MTIATFLEGLGTTMEADAKTQLSTFLTTFANDDLGQMAIAAVQYAEGAVEGASGDEKRETAKTQLLNLAQGAGKDLIALGESFLNFTIETALQAIAAGLASAAIASL